jgi:hypothetical protein
MYAELPYPPNNYHICPCCGTEFGNDDAFNTHEELRRAWADADGPWFFGDPPPLWNPWKQLTDAQQFQEISWLPEVKVQSSVFNIPARRLFADTRRDFPSVQAQTA